MTGGSLRERFEAAGQSWLGAHMQTLDGEGRARLERQLSALDLELVGRLARAEGLADAATGAPEPHPYVSAEERAADTEAAARGMDEFRSGRVAFALLAGGQASRLRWDGPKGSFPIGPATDRSLFQIFIERLRRCGRRYGPDPLFAVTTSVDTDAQIRAFFEEHEHFGFPRGRLCFSCQGTLPALDDQGRLILAAPDRVFVNPDGHGGAVAALERDGTFERWERGGVRTVVTFQVDNPLLPVGDADFVGRLVAQRADIATKIVLKQDPAEKVGLVTLVEGRPRIVEYSEIPETAAAARDADGSLRLRLGSIAVHAFRLGFLRGHVAEGLPLHRALKEIPTVDAQGNEVRRRGLKHERFIFDLFPLARSVEVVEVLREREFEPVKNAEGPESPATARAALEREYRRWYAEAGVPAPEGTLEVSPLHAEGPDDLVI